MHSTEETLNGLVHQLVKFFVLILWRENKWKLIPSLQLFFLVEIYPWCRGYMEILCTSASQTSHPLSAPHLQNFRQPNNAGNKEVEAAYNCCSSKFCINSCVEFHSHITIWWRSQQYLAPLHTRHHNRTSEHKRLTCAYFSERRNFLAHGLINPSNVTHEIYRLQENNCPLLVWIHLMLEQILERNVSRHLQLSIRGFTTIFPRTRDENNGF